uniref:Uncharacterized protein n=1 Tax=Alexandrium monilatum TaxID=311494 RepID=A0A7S4Q9V0_9DINO
MFAACRVAPGRALLRSRAAPRAPARSSRAQSGPPPDTRAPIRFVVYRGGAPHPIWGDEAREESARRLESWAHGLAGEGRPRKAVLALRHPQLEAGEGQLARLRAAYAERLGKGCPVVLLHDKTGIFVRGARLVDDWDPQKATVRVLLPESVLRAREREEERRDAKRGLRREAPAEAPSPVAEVAAEEVFAGWPAFSGELASPVRLLAKEAAYMWPGPLDKDVLLTRNGEPLAAELSLGALLQDVRGVCVCVSGMAYPLEHDDAASATSERAERREERKIVRKIVRTQAAGFLALVLAIGVLQVKIDQREEELERRRRVQLELEREQELLEAERVAAQEVQQPGWTLEFGCPLSELELEEVWPRMLLRATEDQFSDCWDCEGCPPSSRPAPAGPAAPPVKRTRPCPAVEGCSSTAPLWLWVSS